MKNDEWEQSRLHSGPVLKQLKHILSEQNRREINKIELVKGKKRIYYKAYSKKLEDAARKRNDKMDMQEINRLIPFGSEKHLKKCGQYAKFLAKKQLAYRNQTTSYADMRENPGIREWLEKWELARFDENFREKIIRLNGKQLYDTNLALQKRYAYLQWSQGAGKTVSGTAQGMYRLAMGQVDYVFVVSTAISIEGTWAPFLKEHKIPHQTIRNRRELRRILPGDFVLITLGRIKNYKREIQRMTKLASNKLFLIYDEAQNSSALEENDEEARLTKAMFACFRHARYKLLMSGTSINNNVVEAYPQLYLLYNVEAMAGDSIYYDFSNIENKSNVALDDFFWHDLLPTEAVRLEKIWTGVWSERASMELQIKTNLKTGYRTVKKGLLSTVNNEIDCSRSALGLAANEYVTEFKLIFGKVQPGFHEITGPKVQVKVLDSVENLQKFTNKTDVGGKYRDQFIYDTDGWTVVGYNKPKGSLPRTGLN